MIIESHHGIPNLAILSLKCVSIVLILLNDTLTLEFGASSISPKSQNTFCDRMKCEKTLPAISAYDLHPLHGALLPVAWLDLTIFHRLGGSLGPHTSHHHTYPWIFVTNADLDNISVHIEIHKPKYHMYAYLKHLNVMTNKKDFYNHFGWNKALRPCCYTIQSCICE
jgi:hypothetical protein